MVRRSAAARRVFCMALAGMLMAAGPLMAAAERQDGGAGMDRPALAEHNRRMLFGSAPSPLVESDPELAAMRDRLLYGEITENGSLDGRQRALITLVVLAASQTLDEVKPQVGAALRAGAAPAEIKEALYQCAPYIGFPKTEAALRRANEGLAEQGARLPAEGRGTVTEATRYAEGLRVQKAIFGEAIDRMHESTPANQKAIVQNYLTAFCFGDVYTRRGLDLRTRELLTFSILSAIGGCESQVRAHVQGNANVGNSKENLIDALAQSLPYIGFPRTLNALACVNAILPEKQAG